MRSSLPNQAARRVALVVLFTVLLLDAGRAAAQNVGMGVRYAQLDAHAVRTVTDFGSVRAISVRRPDGSLETTLQTADGEELSRLSFSPAGRHLVTGDQSGQGPRFSAPPSLGVTSDWANAQLFSLWQDRAGGSGLGLLAAPVFDGYFFRHPALSSAGKKVAEDHHRSIAAAVRRIRTEFPRVIAEAVRNSKPIAAEDRSGEVHSTLTARLFDRATAQPIGIMQWFPEAQTLSWKLHGQESSFIDPRRLAQARIPGWPFQPTLAWSNVQLYSFYNDQQTRRATAEVALAGSPIDAPSPVQSLRSDSPIRSGAFDAPDQYAGSDTSGISRATAAVCTNEPDGCTGLHWLDDTIYRECCDEHDRCYYKDRSECCTFWSWFFPWQQGWSCAECNLDVVWCFVTGGGGGSGGDGGSGGINEDNECHLDIDEYFCSAECSSCTGGAWP